MGENQSSKILVCGDVLGKFNELFNRVKVINDKNGPFQMLLCVGSFFPESFDENFLIPPAPISTYCIGPILPSQINYFSNLTGCELAENVTYLGQRGVYTEASGLKIAYFSGLEARSAAKKTDIDFVYEDVRNLEVRLLNETNSKGIDILLTSQWPLGVQNNATVQPEKQPERCSPLISRLVSSLKPRYHFCGFEGIHYERVPYRNHEVLAQATLPTTRFIALGTVGNKQKKKWIYAFNIVPAKTISHSELIMQPPDITDNPYSNLPSLNIMQTKESSNQNPNVASANQFFYDSSYTGEAPDRFNKNNRKRNFHQNQGPQGHGKRPRPPPPPPGSCWFCLASPEVEKHLVVSIGDSSYLTLAKGGLCEDHILILPIGHFQSTIELSEDVSNEINKFKLALKKYFASVNKSVVFYERNFKSPHLQIQAVPIPLNKVKELKQMILNYAEREEIEMQEFPSNAQLFQMTKVGFPYFYIELPDESKLFVQIRGKYFPLQFGRELLASEGILNTPEKIDWKQCKASKEVEEKMTLDFRNSFKNFDFTLE